MFVNYNGVDLEIEHVLTWDVRNVLSDDGCDVLYRHYHIAVQCVFNAVATASNKANGRGDVMPTSLNNLSDTLLVERKQLTVTMGGVTILRSPGISPAGLPGGGGLVLGTDAKNGPMPLAANVLSFHGSKTAIVYFEIETW